MSDAEDEPRRPRVATSLRTARPGDLLPLTKGGDVMSPRLYRARVAFGWTGFAISVLCVAGFWGAVLQSPLAGVISGGGTAALLLARWWRTRGAWLAATGALASGRPAEARAALRRIARPRSDRGWAFAHDYLELRIDWALGDHRAALERAHALISQYPQSSRVSSDRTYLLAVTGDEDAAVAALAGAPATGEGAYLTLTRAAAELRVSFLRGELPAAWDRELLHSIAREVLQTSLFGGLCVLLAWAFERRADPEMARHLLDEAPARLEGADLPKLDPPLAAWLAAAR